MKLLVAPFLQIIAPLSVATCLVLSACGSLEIGSEIDESSEMTGADWQTVWQDDFEGDKLDRTKWAPEVSCWGGGNDERQCYTDRPENVYLQDGVLHLKAQAEEYTGPIFPPEIKADLGSERTQAYTSGKVRTRELASWKYGRFSARMKLPEGQGTWPAFWMMSAENVYGNWPLSGEIDIMEAVNLETPCSECPGGIERRTSGALHFGNAIPDNTYLYLNRPGSDAIGPSNQWRTYSVEWAEGVFQWFVDDEIFMRIESDDWFTGSPKAKDWPYAPFDQPFYLMLNLAVGGNLAEQKNGGGFDPSAFPAELLIDWVKVEQCPGDATGRSCLTSTNWSGTPQGPWETQAR